MQVVISFKSTSQLTLPNLKHDIPTSVYITMTNDEKCIVCKSCSIYLNYLSDKYFLNTLVIANIRNIKLVFMGYKEKDVILQSR